MAEIPIEEDHNRDWFLDSNGRFFCNHCSYVSTWDDDDEPWMTWALHDMQALHSTVGLTNRVMIDDVATRDP